MRVVILAGGMGSRLQEQTGVRPKPMVEIGNRPMLWHIMKIYATYGYREFVLALGYKAEMVQDYFLNFHRLGRNVSVELADGSATFHDEACDDWLVHMVNTGIDTQTGGRLRRLRSVLAGEPFMMTYGDGVANVDIGRLVAFHRAHGKNATVTAVRPPARFGGLRLQGDAVVEFEEKPQIGEGWINGGFFVLAPEVLDLITDDHTLWERGPLEQLASAGQLMAYRHSGFWQPMDTLRDVNYLETLWSSGSPPWKVWK
jgi:glucose-1-phosphate cytidylyltransferase